MKVQILAKKKESILNEMKNICLKVDHKDMKQLSKDFHTTASQD
jgi:hypothetical protein